MPLHLVESQDYYGMAGVLEMRHLQHELGMALAEEDWAKVRRLDQACVLLIDRVIAVNKADSQALILAMSELKDVYAGLIMHCYPEVAAMAR